MVDRETRKRRGERREEDDSAKTKHLIPTRSISPLFLDTTLSSTSTDDDSFLGWASP